MLPEKPHKVKIVRKSDTGKNYIQENIPAFIQPKISFFELDVDIKKGDHVSVPHLDEEQIVKKVDILDVNPGGHKEVELTGLSEFLEKESLKTVSPSVNQVFNGDVGKVAGRDIVEYNIPADIYLKAIIKVLDESNDIPPNEKKGLIQTIRKISENPLVRDLSATALGNAIKALLIPS